MRIALSLAFALALTACGDVRGTVVMSTDMAMSLPDGGMCVDKLLDGDETDVDCGGSCPTKCGLNLSCKKDVDCGLLTGAGVNVQLICVLGTCVDPKICHDGFHNGDETDTDCGGPTCAPCDFGKSCKMNSDCISNTCTAGTCVALKLSFKDATTISCVPGILSAAVADVDGDGNQDVIGLSGDMDGSSINLGRDCRPAIFTCV